MDAFPTDSSEEPASAVVAVRLEKIKESSSYSICIFCNLFVKLFKLLILSTLLVFLILFSTSILFLSLLSNGGSKNHSISDKDISSGSKSRSMSGQQTISGTLPSKNAFESVGAALQRRGSDEDSFPPPPFFALRRKVFMSWRLRAP